MTPSYTDYHYYQLSNGIRLIHRHNPSPVSHLALMINTGSRDELSNEFGLAHMIEHMVFKGTKKRKAFHVISRMENVGCDLNAYTTKEETCLHATFLHPHYERALELFADITFNSIFPIHEFEKEKEVIIDEIHSYRDNPAEEIVDEFENQLFSGHQLGHNILGTTESVKQFTRESLFSFTKNNYSPSQIVISSVGNSSFKNLVRMVEKHYGSFPASDTGILRTKFADYQPKSLKEERDNYLTHCYIGNLAFDYNHPQKTALVLLNNILGGPGLNSRLNMNIREKFGFTYSIDSQYTAYSDIGWFGVYLGTDHATVEKAKQLVYKELKKLREEKLGGLQLSRAKQQLIVQIAIGYESGLQETLGIGRNHLSNALVDSMPQIISQIESINSAQLLEIANEIFNPSQLSTLTFEGSNS